MSHNNGVPRKLLMILAASLLATAALFAQWPEYPTRGVPMKNGQPDLTAPAPRMPDGKIDFSGLWEIQRGAIGGPPADGKGKSGAKGKGPGGTPPGVGAAKGKAAAKGKGAPTNSPPLATFFNIGANIPGGLPLRPWAAELLAQRTADHSKDNPDAHCLPIGLMQYHLHPQPRKMIQTQDLLVLLYEANSGVRQIFLDGRKLPPSDVDPWWFGYSVGHWEGDELVVETTRWRDLGWLDVNGSPLSSEGKTIERYRRPNYGSLEIDITVDDPKTYTAPFTVRVNQRVMPNSELIEFVCAENEKDAPHLVGADDGK